MLLTKIVNALTAGVEISGPLACLYLLKHKNYYTNYSFNVCMWKSFMREVCTAWEDENSTTEAKVFTNPEAPEKVILSQTQGKFVLLSVVDDYIYRPSIFNGMCLYDWIW
ncbi:uncharacterized protein LAESUDRAFT_644879 [Laetiporus sulphureus 93-53]|uniref:Uncharacterized protein n=1 Tax=Laetiporus sulphureus 93-53 TaxID=1314785 RepID=A0A165GJ84_9APHY|nr:uncharacterized protein LAESUDRAFT_644879 [Laetiporus sulphureus 93-53]KZT10426.1 hypothetical protein LAESUDRAFT_644879 [Laetiporus sulphureus 93-53]